MLYVQLSILLFIMILTGLAIYEHYYPPVPGEEMVESWMCENCGFVAMGATIEIVLEGIKQHDTFFNCSEDWE